MSQHSDQHFMKNNFALLHGMKQYSWKYYYEHSLVSSPSMYPIAVDCIYTLLRHASMESNCNNSGHVLLKVTSKAKSENQGFVHIYTNLIRSGQVSHSLEKGNCIIAKKVKIGRIEEYLRSDHLVTTSDVMEMYGLGESGHMRVFSLKKKEARPVISFCLNREFESDDDDDDDGAKVAPQHNIVLWNPSIRDYKILPQSQIQRLVGSTVRGSDFGLGFDSMKNDYKVIQILFCLSIDRVVVYQVEIYSLTANSWTKYNGIVPAKIKYGNTSWSMVYKNEIFCWLAQDGDNHEVILSFNMSEETFQNTTLPSNIGFFGEQEIRSVWVIVPFEESISLIVYRLKEVDKYFDIWVISELGVKKCWTKLQRIGPLLRVERPLGFWKNGEFLLENSSGQLVIFYPSNQEVKTLGFYGKRGRLEIVVYKESLISVN
ncbi:hypothetical protein RND71_037617 [Anisodus tanguticus]|uniref:F-box associated beta-propeller type 3 domain-containing protein n=1 Tax=Anisodus tanguticus TaxID=243964 RepID=A0AAE1UW71_9SOLA|nr:hypothetical protein RND71_037617 [Anisodus tanguticus]